MVTAACAGSRSHGALRALSRKRQILRCTMSTETNLDVSLWERFTDTLSTVSEGIVGFLGRMFGSSNDRLVRALGYVRPKGSETHAVAPGSLLERVNALEPLMLELRDDEFEKLTADFRRRLGVEHVPFVKRGAPASALNALPGGEGGMGVNNGDTAPSESFTTIIALMDQSLPAAPTLDDILPYAFAACREVSRRSKNMRHFDVQIVGGAILHQGKIAEMVTGEGKTLVATLPAYLNALLGKGIHIVTVNDYLARRDCEWMSPIYHGLGVTCGYIQSEMDSPDRRKSYDCYITYGTNSEFGFDYLRDNMKPARWGDPSYPPNFHQCQRIPLNFAIIDEVDNILIDEARTPLIISGPSFGTPKLYDKANQIAIELTRMEKKAQEKLRSLGHGVNIPDHPLSQEKLPEPETGIQDTAVTQGIQPEIHKNSSNGESVANAGEDHVDEEKVESYVAS